MEVQSTFVQSTVVNMNLFCIFTLTLLTLDGYVWILHVSVDLHIRTCKHLSHQQEEVHGLSETRGIEARSHHALVLQACALHLITRTTFVPVLLSALQSDSEIRQHNISDVRLIV